MKYFRMTGLVTVWLLLLCSCAKIPQMGQDHGQYAPTRISAEQEIAIGAKIYTQILQKMGGVYPDTSLNRYVDQVGQRLIRARRSSGLSYQFKVVNQSSPNAISLPGGFIAVTRGLLVKLENEAQLAVVLGHEIGHVEARHHVRELQQSRLMAAGATLVGALAEDNGYSTAAWQSSELMTKILNRSYSREQELEADQLGIDSLALAGYSVDEIVALLKDFSTQRDGEQHAAWNAGLFHTHPYSAERLQVIKHYIAQHYPAGIRTAGTDKAAYRVKINALSETRDAYQLYDQAFLAEKNNQQIEAVELYHRAMQELPDHGLLLTALGMAYLRQEDMVPARRYLLRAIQADPDYFQSRLGLGYIYLKSGRSAEAAQQLTQSVDLLPTVQGYFLSAEAEAQTGNTTRATELYQLVISVSGADQLGQVATQRLRNLN